MNPLDIVRSSMIANDKDWDLYQYDRGGQTCRDDLTDYGSVKGNAKWLSSKRTQQDIVRQI